MHRQHFTNRYDGFSYDAAELSAYLFCIDTFVLSLKTGEIVRYTTTTPAQFKAWLEHHRVRDARPDVGRYVYNSYFKEQQN